MICYRRNEYTSFTILRQNWMQINIINNTFLIIYVAGPDVAFRNQVCELCWIDERGKCGWNERWQLHNLRHRNLRFTNHFKCCTLLTGIHCIHYAVYSDLHNVILYLTSCTYSWYCINYCVIISNIILHFSEDSTCPGGPRHKPFGVSRGSPRSLLCI